MELFPAHLQTDPSAAEKHGAAYITGEISRQMIAPPSDDPYIKAECQAFFRRLVYDRSFEDMLSQFARYHKVRSPDDHNPKAGMAASEAVGILRATLQTFMDTRPDLYDYPSEKYLRAYHYGKPLDDLLTTLRGGPDDEATEEVTINLTSRKVQTTIDSRYTAVEEIIQLHRDRFPHGVRLLDIGGGIMQGDKRLLLKDQFPFTDIQALTINEDLPPSKRIHEDSDTSNKLQRLARLPSLINECVAVDIEPIYRAQSRDQYDQKILRWAKGSLRPSERLDRVFMDRFDTLLAAQPPNLHFEQVDFSDATDVREFDQSLQGDTQFDVIVSLTMLHQLSPDGQQALLKHAMEHLADNGLLILQDFFYKRARLLPYNNWHEFGHYRTFVKDKALPKKSSPDQLRGFEEVFINRDSRLSGMAPGMGKLLVNGQILPVKEAIHRSI